MIVSTHVPCSRGSYFGLPLFLECLIVRGGNIGFTNVSKSVAAQGSSQGTDSGLLLSDASGEEEKTCAHNQSGVEEAALDLRAALAFDTMQMSQHAFIGQRMRWIARR